MRRRPVGLDEKVDPAPAEHPPSPSVAGGLRRRRAVWAAALLAVDVLTALVAAWIVPGVTWQIFTAFSVLTVVLFGNGGLYRARLYLSVLDDVPAMAGRTAVAGALATAIGVFGNEWASRSILYFTGAFLVLAVGMRAAAFAVARQARKGQRMRHRALIMGGGEVGALLARTLLDRPESGLDPIGFLDDNPLLALEDWPVPHLGGNLDLVEVVRKLNVDHIVVAFGSAREATVVDVLRDMRPARLRDPLRPPASTRSTPPAATWSWSGGSRSCACAGRRSGACRGASSGRWT